VSLVRLDAMCVIQCVRACVELMLSHSDVRGLMCKATQLLLVLSLSPKFPVEELHRDGAGALLLAEQLQQEHGPDSEHGPNVAALLVLLASRPELKLSVLVRFATHTHHTHTHTYTQFERSYPPFRVEDLSVSGVRWPVLHCCLQAWRSFANSPKIAVLLRLGCRGRRLRGT
jgi:hypothetical protein